MNPVCESSLSMVSAIRSSALPPVYAAPISPLASSTAALTRARLQLQLVQIRSSAAATNRRLDQLLASRGLATAAPTSDRTLGSAETNFIDGSHSATELVPSTPTALVPVTPTMNFPEPIRALPASISSLFGVPEYRGEVALQVLAEMPDSGVPSDFDRGYPQGILDKGGTLILARQVFDESPVRDVVTWTTIIDGHARRNCSEEAMKLFGAMLMSSVEPNEVTMIAVLSACSGKGDIGMGKKVHEIIQKGNVNCSLNMLNALLDMYVKCGCFFGLHVPSEYAACLTRSSFYEIDDCLNDEKRKQIVNSSLHSNSDYSVGLVDVGSKVFKTCGVVHACGSPHVLEQSVVLLENGGLFLFDLEPHLETHWSKPHVKFKGKKLKVVWDDIVDGSGKWLSCEFSWNPQLLMSGSFDEARMLHTIEACEWFAGALRSLEVPNLDPLFANMRAVNEKRAAPEKMKSTFVRRALQNYFASLVDFMISDKSYFSQREHLNRPDHGDLRYKCTTYARLLQHLTSLDKNCLGPLRKVYYSSLHLLLRWEAREFANELRAGTSSRELAALNEPFQDYHLGIQDKGGTLIHYPHPPSCVTTCGKALLAVHMVLLTGSDVAMRFMGSASCHLFAAIMQSCVLVDLAHMGVRAKGEGHMGITCLLSLLSAHYLWIGRVMVLLELALPLSSSICSMVYTLLLHYTWQQVIEEHINGIIGWGIIAAATTTLVLWPHHPRREGLVIFSPYS